MEEKVDTNQTETPVEPVETIESSQPDSEKIDSKKKKPFFVKFLLGILSFLLIIAAVILLWTGFCSINKTSSVKALPPEYSLYIRTDSVWEALSPLIDLQAADIILAEPQLTPFRELFFSLRENKVRNNSFIKTALSRRIDAALYENNAFLAIADMGFLSAVTRIAPFAMNFISIPGLSYVKQGTNSHFEYKQGETILFIKIYKNLVLISDSQDLLLKGMTLKNDEFYSKESLTLLTEKLNEPFRIAADGKKLIEALGSDNQYIKAIGSTLSSTELSTIGFGITDSDINLNAKIPFELDESLKDHPVSKLLAKDSSMPTLLAKLPATIQYYTLLTAGSLAELKNAAFSLLPPEKNIDKIMSTAYSACPSLFGVTLDELLFDWTGNELALLGLEGKTEPVFVMRISDEKKRKYVFDNVLSSIILQSDDSLILDGVRLPSIQMPAFLTNLLKAFDINLPKPYYMVNNGFIYFSQSPENLISLSTSLKNGTRISKNETWSKVSSNQSQYSAVSLYYNLERSVPFFLKGNNILSKVLQLYNVGRADISIKKNTLQFQLQSASCKTTSSQTIAGYPIELEGKPDFNLCKSNAAKSKIVFWSEEGKNIFSLNTANFEKTTLEIENIAYLLSANEKTVKQSGGALWVITKDGVVYLLDEKLEAINGFPLLTGEIPTCKPALYEDSIFLAVKNNILLKVNSEAFISETNITVSEEIRSQPCVKGETIAFYEKGFLGGVHIVRHDVDSTADSPLEVKGIAYGSPCINVIGGKEYVAFVTQAGELTVWDKDNNVAQYFPSQLNGIFYLNVIAADEFFFALSSDGRIFRIDKNNNKLIISIPYLKAKSGFLKAFDYNNDGKEEIFICGEGNSIYGFDTSLQMLEGFPVAGYGEPVFVDVNGDRKNDCLVLSLDDTLKAIKVR